MKKIFSFISLLFFYFINVFGEIPKNVIINNSKSIEYETIDNEKLKLIISIDGVKYSEELFYAYYKDGKIHYNIPAEVFKNNLTTAGDFQYDTDDQLFPDNSPVSCRICETGWCRGDEDNCCDNITAIETYTCDCDFVLCGRLLESVV